MARYDLRLSDREIGRLSLKEFDALIKRHKAAQNYARLNAGIVAAAIYNSAPFGEANRRAISPLDFVPDWKNDEDDLRAMSPDSQKKFFHNLFFKRAG
jgi:hypothetical protein